MCLKKMKKQVVSDFSTPLLVCWVGLSVERNMESIRGLQQYQILCGQCADD